MEQLVQRPCVWKELAVFEEWKEGQGGKLFCKVAVRIVMCQSRSSNCGNGPTQVEDGDSGEGCVHVWEQAVYRKSLYLPLNFPRSLKLL